MQDYINRLIQSINNYNPNDEDSINELRNIICWISANAKVKEDQLVKELLFIASQKMRVFGYNVMNRLQEEPIPESGSIRKFGKDAITRLYRSNIYPNKILDKSQKEVIDLFQSSPKHRLLVSAPTSYGKTFLMREIIFLNKERYNNILLVFPTVALLVENARELEKFVSEYGMEYNVIKTIDSVDAASQKNIFVFTPERALQLISNFPNLNIDFFFFDEVYKINEDYCNDGSEEESDEKPAKTENEFLYEDRGKTFRIALYLLAKRVKEYYIAGPNLTQEQFGLGMRRFLQINEIDVKEIKFEPTLRISVDAYNKHLCEHLPKRLTGTGALSTEIIPSGTKVNERIKSVVQYIDKKKYGKTLLYCNSPGKAVEYSTKLAKKAEQDIVDSYPTHFKSFMEHIEKEYNVDDSAYEWSLLQILKKGFGMHHGKLPKYIQQEILAQFNKGTFNILFCTSTIVEGVNTDAQNIIILNASKGNKTLTSFDIKNIRGRAGRYYHCFIGRVFYFTKKLKKIENAEDLSLDFVTYSDKPLSVIDLDNANIYDLTEKNQKEKNHRESITQNFKLPEEVFIKNRTVSKENQECLINALIDENQFSIYKNWITYEVNLESFFRYNWMGKILGTFVKAGLIDEKTEKRFSAISNSFYTDGFRGLLKFEIDEYKKGNRKTVDDAYSRAFNNRRDVLEHKIPKILSLFESILIFVAEEKGVNTEKFSLTKVRRYYETGVKSILGEALIEYGFPVDAIRKIEEKYSAIINMNTSEAKVFCRRKYNTGIKFLLDEYENELFVKVMRTL